MPEFLAETYTSRKALIIAALRTGELAPAAAHPRGPGAPVWFLGAIAAPAEEIGTPNTWSARGRYTRTRVVEAMVEGSLR
jgi:hypothetical protein